MLGRFLNLNKMKTKRLSNHFSQYILFTIAHREHNKWLNWENVHFYPLNEPISNLMSATGLKKLARGKQRAEKARCFEKIQLGEHLATN